MASLNHSLFDALAAGPLLADGAMGTMLHARGVAFDRCFDELNLTQPESVTDIHRAYVDAGAGMLITTLFALQRQQTSLSAEALNQKGREFQQKVNDLERSVQGKRQALEKSNGEALSKIQEEMLKIIADIAKQRKSNLVFQRADLVLFDQSFDVTDEVLQKLDEQMPALTVNFVAPVLPPAPSAAAAQPTSSATPKPKKK